MNYNINEYRKWLEDHVHLSSAYTIESLREITHHLLMGRNYRLITENNTKTKLFFAYAWLISVVKNAKDEFGDDWKEQLMSDLVNNKRKTPEQANLLNWLIGLTKKTAGNLGISSSEYPEALSILTEHVSTIFNSLDSIDIDDTWLLMMAGSATLNIRGSDKSKVGKVLERVLIKASLSILGLRHNVDFWTNIQRDNEVDRESDAEIRTTRGRIHVEVGLISSGNQEVTEDKIGRVGRNGVILFDKVGSKTRIYQTAERHSVKLIQIRNNQPLVEIYRHISPLVDYPIVEPPTTEEAIRRAVDNLSDEVFEF